MALNPNKLFVSAPKKTSAGKTYQGRFACHDIQWTGRGDDFFGTFTITADELADAALGGLLWTDQDVQRGIRPEISSAKRELSLADGYPDPGIYVFDDENADEIVEKLLHGSRLFLSPLVRSGIMRPSRDGRKLTVTNTGASRAEAGRILRQLLTVTAPPKDLSFLLER